MGDYSYAQRQKNRRNIVLGACFWIALILLTALIRGTGSAAVIAGSVVVLLVSAIMWWLFTSSGARPLVAKKLIDRFGAGPL